MYTVVNILYISIHIYVSLLDEFTSHTKQFIQGIDNCHTSWQMTVDCWLRQADGIDGIVEFNVPLDTLWVISETATTPIVTSFRVLGLGFVVIVSF